jgi:hypothetical protein
MLGSCLLFQPDIATHTRIIAEVVYIQFFHTPLLHRPRHYWEHFNACQYFGFVWNYLTHPLMKLHIPTWRSVVPPVQNRSPRHSGKYGNTYQATTSEDITDFMCATVTVICRVCRSAKVTGTVVTIYRCSLNPITNPNPVSSH